MKIFISWSGEKSKGIAEVLKRWIGKIIQSTYPWFSSEIEKGKKWSHEIISELEQSKFGIICVTRDNMNKPWLLFEAGAIAKSKDSHVCCFLTDIKPTDLMDPLSLFQATELKKEDVYKLLEAINSEVQKQSQKGIEIHNLRSLFETFYPELEKEINNILTAEDGAEEESAVRTDRELLEETIQTLRDIKQNTSSIQRDKGIAQELRLELIDLYVKEFSLITKKIETIYVGDVEYIDEFINFLKSKPFLKPTLLMNEDKIKDYLVKHYDSLPF